MRWLFAVAFVDKFIGELLRDLAPMLPASSTTGQGAGKTAKRQQKLDAAAVMLRQRAVEFGRRENLNLFQKAHLSKQLQDGLIRGGQSAEFAQSVALEVVTELK